MSSSDSNIPHFRARSGHQAERTEGILGKNLPASIDAEKAVLAAILLNDDNVTLVSDLLGPEDFYSKQHQVLFQAILELSQASKRIDLVVLQDHLEKNKELEAIGGLSYLIELQEDIPAIGLITQHAKIVKDKAILRSLIHSAADIITTCFDQKKEDIDSVLDNAEQKIYHISDKLTPATFVQLDILLKQTFKHLAHIKGHQEGVTGVPSGFGAFDTITSGMQKGDLLILAARPSMGKTALALNIMLNAWKTGASVGLFSLEMSSEQLILRMLSAESEIPNQKIRNALVSPEEWVTLTNHAAALAEAKIFIDDSPSLNIMELRAKARKLKAREKIQLLIIDYLQLINSHTRHENRTQEISAISRALKSLAKELDIPILALSQLSRSLESRMDKRPMLSDLRESGAIEQDGDVIFFVYRDVVYNPDTEYPDMAEVIIGKQRNGPIGSFNVRFRGEIQRFDDVSSEVRDPF
ncbi:MAG: replicative DNA helicase [bacterium]